MKKYLPTYAECFVCGKNNLSGLKRRFYVDCDESGKLLSTDVCADIAFPKEYEGFKGVVHGGIVTALIDEAMGWASTVQTKLMYVTAELKIRFLKPVLVGKPLIFKARMTDNNKITHNEGEVYDLSGTLLVRASGKFFPLGDDDMKKVMDYLLFVDDSYDIF